MLLPCVSISLHGEENEFWALINKLHRFWLLHLTGGCALLTLTGLLPCSGAGSFQQAWRICSETIAVLVQLKSTWCAPVPMALEEANHFTWWWKELASKHSAFSDLSSEAAPVPPHTASSPRLSQSGNDASAWPTNTHTHSLCFVCATWNFRTWPRRAVLKALACCSAWEWGRCLYLPG